jgi:hypothetical protein
MLEVEQSNFARIAVQVMPWGTVEKVQPLIDFAIVPE